MKTLQPMMSRRFNPVETSTPILNIFSLFQGFLVQPLILRLVNPYIEDGSTLVNPYIEDGSTLVKPIFTGNK